MIYNNEEINYNRSRHFIITKRKKPIRFKDMNLKSFDYEFVDSESSATIFDSMTELMIVLDKLCKDGESGIWYKEIDIMGDVDEHLYVYVLDYKIKKYVGYNTVKRQPFFTQYVQKAFKTSKLSEIIEFGLEKIPKDSLNDLKIIDLKEADTEYSRIYLFFNRNERDKYDMCLDKWFKLADDEAFKNFTNIIDSALKTDSNSDIFKREVLKLIGARRYLTGYSDSNNQEFTKNALINVFCKLIAVKVNPQYNSIETMLYIEWFIRNKLMTASEVRWLIKTRWFSKASEQLQMIYHL